MFIGYIVCPPFKIFVTTLLHNIVVQSKIAGLYTSQCPLISKIRFFLHDMHFIVINKLPTLKRSHKVEITTSGINRGPCRISSKLS